jgi:hypothetical protein
MCITFNRCLHFLLFPIEYNTCTIPISIKLLNYAIMILEEFAVGKVN